MQRKLSILAFFYLLPFIAVWIAWICTAMSFDARAVFNEEAFWGISMFYWFVLGCVTPAITQAINETA
jgi:uncharacterized membrane protein